MPLPSNWKHSWTLIATCVFGFVVFSPETFSRLPWLISLSKFAMAGGLAALGIAAHTQSVANAAAIKSVDDRVAETQVTIDGRMEQLMVATKAQGRQDERDEARSDAEQAKKMICPLGKECPLPASKEPRGTTPCPLGRDCPLP
jgi:hypothetical protein